MENKNPYKTLFFQHLPNNETLAYRFLKNSSAKTLFLIHGHMTSSEIFTNLSLSLSKSYQILSIDLRGFGNSSNNSPIKSLHEFADDLNYFFQALKLSNCIVAGYSLGGGVAMSLAARYPALVYKLILLNPIGIDGVPLYKNEKRIKNFQDCVEHPAVFAGKMAIEMKNKEVIREMMLSQVFNEGNNYSKEFEDCIVNAVIQQRNFCECMFALNAFNIGNKDNEAEKASNLIEKIKCRVLILHGENDLVIKKKKAEAIAEKLGERAQLVVFKNSGHCTFEDKPVEVVEKIKSFVEDNPKVYSKL